MQINKLIFTAVGLLLTAPLFAQEPHVHGAADCELVFGDDGFEAVITIPAHSVTGFEHAPQSDEEHKIFDEAVERLNTEAETYISARGFMPEHAAVESAEEHHAHETEHAAEEAHAEEAHAEEVHSDFIIHSHFVLSGKSAPRNVRIDFSAFFEAFPDIEELNWVAIMPGGQSAGEATPASARIRIR